MPSSAATLAALRPLLRHNSSASFLYSSVYLALLRDGLLNCVFMWAPSGFSPFAHCPSIQCNPRLTPFCYPCQDLLTDPYSPLFLFSAILEIDWSFTRPNTFDLMLDESCTRINGIFILHAIGVMV